MPFTSSKPDDEDNSPRGYGGGVMTLLEPDRGRPRPLATDFAGAAEMSGLSRSALYQAAGRGELLVHKWRARSVILIADLEAYLKSLPLGSYSAPTRG